MSFTLFRAVEIKLRLINRSRPLCVNQAACVHKTVLFLCTSIQHISHTRGTEKLWGTYQGETGAQQQQQQERHV